MITGNDPTSIEVLKKLDMKSIRLKDIPAEYGLSIDQAKRLSRYGKMVRLANEHLSVGAVANAKALGFKIMVLSNLFKMEDWEGLDDILSACEPTTTRETIKSLIDALASKRRRVEEYKFTTERKLNEIEHKKALLEERSEKLKEIKESIESSIGELSKYDEKTKEFLIEHIGINTADSDDRYVLIKRLDSSFTGRLKKIGALRFDKNTYSLVVRNIDLLVEEYQKRRKKGNYIYWNYKREQERSRGSYYPAPDTPYYKKSNKHSLVEDGLLEKVEAIKQEYQQSENEIKQAERELREVRKENVKSFIEAAEASDAFSARDIKRHAEIQTKVGRWLFSQGYAVAFEVTFPNGRRGDVVGFSEDKKIIMVEVKASVSDFTGDKKWQDYLQYCDEFYFCSDFDLSYWAKDVAEALHRKDSGYLVVDGRSTKVERKDRLPHPEIENRDEIIFSIAKSASKKLLYGY